MGEWKEIRLGEVFKVKHGFAFKGTNITADETSSVLVTPGNFYIGGGFKSGKFKFYNGEIPEDYILHEDDIVVTMTDLSKESDTLGYAAKIPKSDKYLFLHNQRIGLLQFKSDEVCKDFVYWLMRTKDYQAYIVGSASGTSIMHTSPSRIEGYIGAFPPLPEQNAIASVLSSLDNKIDLLHRQNATLEAMAESLFRQWFDEQENEGNITQLIAIQNGYAFKSKDFRDAGIERVIKIKNISDGVIDIYKSDFIDESVANSIHHKFKINSGDILIAMTGAEIGKLGIIPRTEQNLWLNQRVGLLREKYRGSKYLAYLQLKSDYGQDYIENTATGSAQPNISGTGIENCGFPILSEAQIKEYSLQIGELYEKVIFNLGQASTLTKLRDTLLPKLMSGQVTVELEPQPEEAAAL